MWRKQLIAHNRLPDINNQQPTIIIAVRTQSEISYSRSDSASFNQSSLYKTESH